MAYSQVGIVNVALARIGEDAITSIDGSDATSILAKQVWEYVLDEVLCAHNWGFAKKRYALAVDATAPVGGDYDYRYALPSDYLKAIKIYPSLTDFVIEAGYLLTNYDNSNNDLVVHYIRREINPAMFSPHFIAALAWRLAGEMAFRILRESSNVQDRCMNMYDAFLTRAIGVDQGSDYVVDEKGSTAWVNAGRDALTDLEE